MRQIEFEIHAAFCPVMGIKICRQSEAAAKGESLARMEVSRELGTGAARHEVAIFSLARTDI